MLLLDLMSRVVSKVLPYLMDQGTIQRNHQVMSSDQTDKLISRVGRAVSDLSEEGADQSMDLCVFAF